MTLSEIIAPWRKLHSSSNSSLSSSSTGIWKTRSKVKKNHERVSWPGFSFFSLFDLVREWEWENFKNGKCGALLGKKRRIVKHGSFWTMLRSDWLAVVRAHKLIRMKKPAPRNETSLLRNKNPNFREIKVNMFGFGKRRSLASAGLVDASTADNLKVTSKRLFFL